MKGFIFISSLIVFGFMLLCLTFGKISQSEQEPLEPAMVQNPNNPAIDYDWDRGVYIYRNDTMVLMKDPNRATWIPKQEIKYKEYKTDSALIKSAWKDEMAIEDMGDEIREYYDK